MTSGGIPTQKGQSRPFVIEGAAGPTHQPSYESCLMIGALDHALGDIERIECPDPNRYNDWVEVAQVQTAEDRPTSEISGRYPINKESILERLTLERCLHDIQEHFGRCTDPSNFNDCEKARIFEGVRFSNYNTSESGALASGDNAVIDETATFSMTRRYITLPITLSPKGDDVVVNPVVDVVICDFPSCGDCTSESDGCEVVFAVDDGATGSPGTAPDLLWSDDKGQTWNADDIDSLDDGEAATGVACLNEYVVVISNADGGLHYKLKSDILAGTASGWTRVATGFVTGGEPNDIWSVGTKAFIVGDGGYVYSTTDPTTGVTVLDAGLATAQDLNGVHAINENFAVAVGDSDTIIYTNNGTSWQAASAVTGGAANLNCVWIVDEERWWVGDAAGDLYYTIDGAVIWAEKGLPGTLWTAINDIAFATNSVGRIAADKSGTPKGFILETWDGGYSWTALPRGVGSGSFPANDSMKALAVCEHDPNFVVGVGTNDNATDGIILVGQGAT